MQHIACIATDVIDSYKKKNNTVMVLLDIEKYVVCIKCTLWDTLHISLPIYQLEVCPFKLIIPNPLKRK